jgi:hypothetical protein
MRYAQTFDTSFAAADDYADATFTLIFAMPPPLLRHVAAIDAPRRHDIFDFSASCRAPPLITPP